jgi:hypothetical protein
MLVLLKPVRNAQASVGQMWLKVHHDIAPSP